MRTSRDSASVSRYIDLCVEGDASSFTRIAGVILVLELSYPGRHWLRLSPAGTDFASAPF